ncbi:MAG TPA: MgtC/SapB family protein, partial [Burkholderiaceae bacterium]|nr:MgtC/SapB family protein [Burkholderiaceae bacterium]
MLASASVTLSTALTFATSGAIGLLVGLERERNPAAKAGLRTFALIALLGTLSAQLAQAVDSGWVVALGLGVVGAAIAGAYFVDPRSATGDAGLTTVIAAMVVFCLGAINFHGHRALAVTLGVAMTALLHFKVELEGAARRLSPRDIRSMLQFAAVSVVILPLLPNEAYGPYAALNPFHIWLMVVLISGVSLAGYVAWRLT